MVRDVAAAVLGEVAEGIEAVLAPTAEETDNRNKQQARGNPGPFFTPLAEHSKALKNCNSFSNYSINRLYLILPFGIVYTYSNGDFFYIN